MKPLGTLAPFVNSDRRLLVIVLPRGMLDFHDFLEIAKVVNSLTPTIAFGFATPDDVSTSISKEKWSYPALTIGIGNDLGRFNPPRGRILHSQKIKKIDQYNRFKSVGIDSPLTDRFDVNTEYRDDQWGEFVVLKPLPLTATSTGAGVRLIRTRRLEELKVGQKLAEFMGRDDPVLVQSFVDTGTLVTHWRVLTFLGKPLYSMKFWSPIPRPDLTSSDDQIEQAIIETKHPDLRKKFRMQEMRELVSEPDILAFAQRVFDAHPTVPLQGIDILREESTGKLYALEINGGGNVWHFSSPRSKIGREGGITKEERINQFGAWRIAAEALIAATVRYAC